MTRYATPLLAAAAADHPLPLSQTATTKEPKMPTMANMPQLIFSRTNVSRGGAIALAICEPVLMTESGSDRSSFPNQRSDTFRPEGRGCARVHLKVRFAPFYTVTRIRKLPEPTYDASVITQTAFDLLHRLDDHRPIRLLGVRAEMVPPEGGYDPPRTHGRRGGP